MLWKLTNPSNQDLGRYRVSSPQLEISEDIDDLRKEMGNLQEAVAMKT